jgi:hypothetical protein
MAGETEILEISKRNLKAAKWCEKETNNIYAKGYFKGKQDAINHILQLMTEGHKNGK